MRRLLQVRSLGVLVATLVTLTIAGTWIFAAGETKTVNATGDHVYSSKDPANSKIRVTTFSKATITQGDATFVADNVVARSQDKVHEFTCTGNPVFTDPENKITSDKVLAYSSPRRAEFSGNVKMVSTPKPKDAKKDDSIKSQMSNDPSTTTCEKLSYDYANKTALATGNVMVVQKERTIWADQGTYDQKQELIALKGNVRMKNAGKEEVKEMKDADIVTVSLDKDWIDITAKPGSKVEFVFEVPEEDNTTPKDTKKK